MAKISLLFLYFLATLSLPAQTKNQRVVADNNKKFLYSDTGGVTASYIHYFTDHFPVPDLTTVTGKMIRQEDLQGKTVVYNFWFLACRPCIAEIPALNKLANKYQSDSIIFLALTFDKEEPVREFLQKKEFAYQIASLPQTEIEKIKKIAFYPFTAIVTKSGKLSFALFGRAPGKNPTEEIFNLLDKQVEKVLN